MPKLGMEPIRRRQLIDATIAAIHEEGYGHTTLSQIGRRAGLSTGIVAHYFHDKSGLIEATMRHLAEKLRLGVVERLNAATSPRERLHAVIDANFAPDQCTPDVSAAWLAFWSQASKAPNLARIQRIYEHRMQSNIQSAMKHLCAPSEVSRLSIGLAAVIDGLWLRSAVHGGAFSSDEARDIARRYLAAHLPVSGVA